MPIMQNEDCPNYLNGRLQTGYNYFNPNDNSIQTDPYTNYPPGSRNSITIANELMQRFKENHPEYSDITSFSEMSVNDKTTCFNICGSDHYIENLGSRSQCSPCPSKPDGWTQENMIGETDEIRQLREDGVLGMCQEFNSNVTPKGPSDNQYDEPNWFSRQQSFNLKRTIRNQINWTSSEAQNLWLKYELYGDNQINPKMSDQQLKAMFGRRVPGEFNQDGESRIPTYVLPDKYGNPNNEQQQLIELRNQINTGRGSVVTGCSSQGGLWECSGENYGPNDIIYEEAYDYWLSEFDRLDPSTDSDRDTSGVSAFSDLMSGLHIDSNFESCVNGILNTGDNDREIQTRISNYTKISDFNPEDISYLQGKLRKIILTKETHVNECLNMLNIGESVCVAGVSEKMLQIGHLVISIIGANKINMKELDIDDRYKLNSMIDRLGHLLPQAVKNLIHISKQYETRVCNSPSSTTLMLERLYNELYDRQTNVNIDLSSYVDFTSLIDTPNTIDGNVRFIKTIVVMLTIGYLLFHLTDFVSKFLSRGKSE